MNFNKAIILGNLTKDPEARALPSGQSVVSFTLATNRIYMDKNGAKQQSTEFHNVVAFGKLADICSRYLVKGGLALIEGRIQTRVWVDQSGVKKYRTEIIAEGMQMGPRRDGAMSGQPNSNTPSAATPAAPVEDIPVIDADTPFSNDQEEIDTKNIPF